MIAYGLVNACAIFSDGAKQMKAPGHVGIEAAHPNGTPLKDIGCRVKFQWELTAFPLLSGCGNDKACC